jgi:hypothetical protein
MKLASDGKISVDGIISSNEIITEKEGYEAMLYMLKAYWQATGSNDLTDTQLRKEFIEKLRKCLLTLRNFLLNLNL